MALFQPAPKPEDVEKNKPLEIPPEEVLTFDEPTWYARAYRGEDVPQLTVRAVMMGTALGFLLAFTNVYIGLKTGWHLGVAITACILSFSIWNTLLRVGAVKTPMSILETNCMQSTASAAGYATGNTLATAIPALLILSVTDSSPGGMHLPFWVLGTWVLLLAALGVFLAIPMKRNMINQERLKFPSGVAAAVTLQSLYSQGAEALAKGRALFIAGAVGLLVPLLKDLGLHRVTTATGKVVREGLMPEFSKIFDWLPTVAIAGKTWKMSDLGIKLDHSGVLVAAGAIIGLRVTISMMVGSLILAFYLSPIALANTWTNPSGVLVAAASKPASAWKEIGIWFGAPLLVASALVSFAFQWRTIARAFSSLGGGAGAGVDEKIARTEAPMSWFPVGAGVSGVGIVILAWLYFEIPPHYGILAVLMTFVLALVACRATGETDITPSGAMGKIMQLTYGVLIPQSTTANLMTAGITSGAALSSADLLNDLKSGYLLGANPRRQFIAQLSGIFTGTLASVLGFFLLVPDASALVGVDGRDPAFPAPGAQQWKAVAEVFKYGFGNLHPMARTCIVWGLSIGVALSLIEALVPKDKKKWFPSASGLGLGFILPFYNPLAMFLGALIAWGIEKISKSTAERYTIAIASGLIAGESIMGVVVAALNNFVLK